MNNEEAKFIMKAYRPSGSDAGSEMFAEALKQAKQDPVLAAWLAREQAHDAAVAKKVGQIRPPEGLRESILAGARVSGPRKSFWRQPGWLAMGAAAAVALVIFAVAWPKPALAEEELLAEWALKDVASDGHAGPGEGVELRALQTLLGDPKTRLRDVVGLEGRSLADMGCRSITMEGREVFEICFNRNGTWFHLYATRTSAAPDSIERRGLRIIQREQYCSATWSDSATGFRYAVVGAANVETVKGLL